MVLQLSIIFPERGPTWKTEKTTSSLDHDLHCPAWYSPAYLSDTILSLCSLSQHISFPSRLGTLHLSLCLGHVSPRPLLGLLLLSSLGDPSPERAAFTLKPKGAPSALTCHSITHSASFASWQVPISEIILFIHLFVYSLSGFPTRTCVSWGCTL